jgi:class 3 adenylate cyclase
MTRVFQHATPAQMCEGRQQDAFAAAADLARAERVSALSERLSGHLDTEAAQALFERTAAASIAFEPRVLTLLYAPSVEEEAGWSASDRESFLAYVAWLTLRCRGNLDRFERGGIVAFFEEPVSCVRMATALQRSAADMHLRMGIHTGICDIATFRIRGKGHCTLLGPQAALAARVAASAARGSIMISPASYELVQADIHADPRGCILTEEFEDSEIPTASLTPAPIRGGPAASTFAGLG